MPAAVTLAVALAPHVVASPMQLVYCGGRGGPSTGASTSGASAPDSRGSSEYLHEATTHIANHATRRI